MWEEGRGGEGNEETAVRKGWRTYEKIIVTRADEARNDFVLPVEAWRTSIYGRKGEDCNNRRPHVLGVVEQENARNTDNKGLARGRTSASGTEQTTQSPARTQTSAPRKVGTGLGNLIFAPQGGRGRQ